MEEQQHLELEFDHGDLRDQFVALVGVAVLRPPAVDDDDVGGLGVFAPHLRQSGALSLVQITRDTLL